MVDNTIALQVRPFQMPDVGQIYGQAQNIQMNRMRMAEAQETAQERNALRGLLSSGLDPYSAEGLAQVRRTAPMLSPQFEQAAGQRAVQQAQVRQYNTRADAERFKLYRGQLGSVNSQDAWTNWRNSVVQEFPQFAASIPERFSPQARLDVAGGADLLIQRATAEAAAAAARPPAQSAREQRIADTMTTFGVDRPTAVGLVDNIITVVPGSAGEPPVLVNKLTNEIVTPRMGAARPAAAPTAPTAPEAPAIDLRRPQAAAPAAPTNMMLPGATAAPAPASVEDLYAGRRLRQVEQAGQTAEAQARAQAVVRGEERPTRVQEAGDTALAQARARATAEQEEEARKRQRGQRQLEDTLSEMLAQYEELRRLGGITSSAEGASLSNIPAFVSGMRIGQLGSRAVATPSQTARDQLQSLQNQLLQAFKGATGMTGKEADSNQDVLRLLAAMSDPTMSIEAVRGILQSFSRRYGLGELVIPETPAPAAAPSREQTPGPRRGAAPPAAPAAGTRPTLEQFLARARQANPGATDQQLTDFWNQRYGGR